ncbi:transposable element tc3 transposase, partial [Golovinomyces cichoracearum]
PENSQQSLPKLGPDQVGQIEAFVRLSRKNRQRIYQDLAFKFVHWGAGKCAIQIALESRGYSRLLSHAKPPLSEAYIKICYEWDAHYINLGYEDWNNVLWSDETWVTDGRHRDVYVTRRPGDELEQTCIMDKMLKKTAWMFWGELLWRSNGDFICSGRKIGVQSLPQRTASM